MDKKPKYEFNQQAATQNLRGQQVIFSINNPRLDHEFNMQFGPIDDYVEKNDGIYYILSPQQFDRFIDFAMSMGFDIDKDINQLDSISEQGNVTGAGEAFLPSLHAKRKKINPFIKENLDFYKIEVAVSDARKAIDIIQSDRVFSRNVRIYSSNVFIIDDAEVAQELFDEFEKAQIQMVDYMVPGEMTDFYESILSGYKEVTGFRPGHTPDKGGFQYKDLWGVNELKENIERNQKVKIIKGRLAGNTAIVHDFDSNKDTASGDDWVDVLIGDKKEKKTVKAFELKPLNENYSKFRNSTKTRSGSEQYHQAVKLVKKKVQEISKLHSYMERMQQELSETQEGLKKKKYTQMAIDKIKAEIKELNKKVRKLK